MKYIAKEGLIFILLSLILSFIFLFSYFFVKFGVVSYLLLASFIFFSALFIFNIYFFRDPERSVLLGDNEFLCPADGKIIFLQKVFDDRFLNREAIKISIFMSLFNVHVNRVPFTGIVEEIKYNKGKFFSANLDKASIENEYNGVILNIVKNDLTKENESGGESETIAFVQIAGLVARRIVCKIKIGDKVTAGERFGLIRYGSRLDLYLPLNFQNFVKIGDKVYAGKTILGKI